MKSREAKDAMISAHYPAQSRLFTYRLARPESFSWVQLTDSKSTPAPFDDIPPAGSSKSTKLHALSTAATTVAAAAPSLSSRAL
mmetsp:Transcript_8322/g.14727  ORF Transcript_8322/g.14727 Transcript_8322/m.14727 type:complete len:84 (-) Transcript_8322:60-311(-)